MGGLYQGLVSGLAFEEAFDSIKGSRRPNDNTAILRLSHGRRPRKPLDVD